MDFHHRFIVFDLDGTLVDSQHTVVHCMSLAFDGLGLPVPEPAAIRSTIGLKLEIALERDDLLQFMQQIGGEVGPGLYQFAWQGQIR